MLLSERAVYTLVAFPLVKAKVGDLLRELKDLALKRSGASLSATRIQQHVDTRRVVIVGLQENVDVAVAVEVGY